MKIVCSRCLIGINCKYNGGNNDSEKLHSFIEKNHCEVITVCPEEMGGLSTPRTPSEICNGKVMNRNGEDVDMQFHKGAEIAMDIVKKEKPDLVILQSRSPSCGLKEVYDGTFSGHKVKGAGVFAQMLIDNGIKAVDIEDL